MEYIIIISGLSALFGSTWVAGNKLFVITEMLVVIREQGRINNIAIESLRTYDESINIRLSSVENYLEKTSDFQRR